MKLSQLAMISPLLFVASVNGAPRAEPLEITLSVDEIEPTVHDPPVNLTFGRDIGTNSKTYTLSVPLGEVGKPTGP